MKITAFDCRFPVPTNALICISVGIDVGVPSQRQFRIARNLQTPTPLAPLLFIVFYAPSAYLPPAAFLCCKTPWDVLSVRRFCYSGPVDPLLA